MYETKLSSESAPVSPTVAAITQITLQVGERRFVTTSATLVQESQFFSTLLSGRWSEKQPDGSYFIDADGQLFVHILAYLRRGVLPVFYDNAKGHDHALYAALLEEAKYFQITRLEDWIQGQLYLKAVKIMRSAEEVVDTAALTESTGADVDVEYHPSWRTIKVYICPRNIPRHRGKPSFCGRLCRRAQSDADDEYEEEDVVSTLVVRTQTIFDQSICVAGR